MVTVLKLGVAGSARAGSAHVESREHPAHSVWPLLHLLLCVAAPPATCGSGGEAGEVDRSGTTTTHTQRTLGTRIQPPQRVKRRQHSSSCFHAKCINPANSTANSTAPVLRRHLSAAALPPELPWLPVLLSVTAAIVAGVHIVVVVISSTGIARRRRGARCSHDLLCEERRGWGEHLGQGNDPHARLLGSFATERHPTLDAVAAAVVNP